MNQMNILKVLLSKTFKIFVWLAMRYKAQRKTKIL
jgi:hypothetical protein